MNIIESTKKIFDINSISYSERVRVCEINLTQKKDSFPSYVNLQNYITMFSERDNVKMCFTKPNESFIMFSVSTVSSELDDFLADVDNNEDIDIYIEVRKNIRDSKLSIYCYSEFSEDILNNNLFELMVVFSGLITNQKFLIFDVFDTDIFWCTKTMAFIHDENIIFDSKFDRLERLEKCKNVSYNYSNTHINLLPDDFSISTDYNENCFKNAFDRIRTILSLSYIASLSSINDNHISGQINGQRNLSFSYELKHVNQNEELFNIYDWIFTDGNPTDKSIIAHNILSLHCKFSDILSTDVRTLSAITSNYQLYLKDNANKYLEAKDKVAEYICNTVSTIGSTSTELLSDFKKNLVAIFGFIVSAFLVNIVSQQPLDNIFTKDITIIVESVLLGSVVYFIICLLETVYRFRKSKESYTDLKKNYSDIFSDTEMKQIFGEDKLYHKSTKSVKKGIWIFSLLWCLVIIVGFIIVESVSQHAVITPILSDLYHKVKIIIMK